MVNSVLNAITKQLGDTFGNSYHYYMEDISQGFKTPCFYVTMRLPQQRSTSSVLYDRTMPVVVHYFSDSENDLKNNCYTVSEQLVECLEYLPFKNTILRGEDISWQIVDDILQVFLTYKFKTKRVTKEETNMETVIENFTQVQ